MRVIYSFPHPLGGTGIGTTAWHEVDSLARSGAEVTAVCTRLDRPFDADLPITVRRSLGPVRPRMLGMARAYRLHDLRTAAEVRRARPDVVHAWPGSVLATVGAARSVRAVVVRSAPSPYTRVAVAQAARAWAELGLTVPEGHFHQLDEEGLQREDLEFASVDAVVVGSVQAAESFSAASFPVRVEVSPYGYDASAFPPEPGPLPDRAPIATFVGRLEPAKGIHVLLRAWRRAARPAGARLVLCGASSDVVDRRLGDLLTQPGVEALGHVADVPAALGASDVLVLPSYSEGSALVGYEALGAGIVPVVSDASGCPVVHELTGLVHRHGDEDALVAHLERVLSDRGELIRLRGGVLGARGQWTWEACGPRLLGIYKRLARHTHARPMDGPGSD